eukprot:gnl/TRDRNA2_/TRDRNA2_168127_c0_seq2.p1 gnl/TRDRNA2_/TRDRNA2_168127_c0~~gnl/TRDRNA2_/TRDRNA2_168127_c0_seq2.p1  ORF type:complete len:211 (-),score=17.88 gnl/TRDRNA2_/TRDRNA2_168127_c0_seq2:94-726(-)
MDLEVANTAPLFTYPTMVVGIDIYRSPEGEHYLGFAASLNRHCTEYYSKASVLDGRRSSESISVRMQENVRDAILHFSRANDGLLPEHFVVYRASVVSDEWEAIRATEIEAFLTVGRSVGGRSARGEPYEPYLTFIAIAKNVGARFFLPSPNRENVKNPEPGTVIDSPLINRPDMHNFFLINQNAGKGTAVISVLQFRWSCEDTCAGTVC